MAIGRRGILAGGAALWVGAPAILRAQSSSKVNVSHGMAMHGEPKYPANAGPPEFVNPSAPKGGAVKFGTLGTYDSLHPFTLKGVPAVGIDLLWETLCRQSPDEAFTVYGLIAETIESGEVYRPTPTTGLVVKPLTNKIYFSWSPSFPKREVTESLFHPLIFTFHKSGNSASMATTS